MTKIFLLKANDAPEIKQNSLLSNEVLGKFGDVITLDVDPRKAGLSDHVNNNDDYVNIVLHAHGVVGEDGIHYIGINGQRISSENYLQELVKSANGHKIKLFVTSCFGENMQKHLEVLPIGSTMITLSVSNKTTAGANFNHPSIQKLVDVLPPEQLNFDKLLQIYCLFQQMRLSLPSIGVNSLQGPKIIKLDNNLVKSYIEDSEFSEFFNIATKKGVIPENFLYDTLFRIYKGENIGDLILGPSLITDALQKLVDFIFQDNIQEDVKKKFVINFVQYTDKMAKELLAQITTETHMSDQHYEFLKSNDIFINPLVSSLITILDGIAAKIQLGREIDVAQEKKYISERLEKIKKMYAEHIDLSELMHTISATIEIKKDTGDVKAFDFITKYSVALSCAAEKALEEAKVLTDEIGTFQSNVKLFVDFSTKLLSEVASSSKIDTALQEFDALESNPLMNLLAKILVSAANQSSAPEANGNEVNPATALTDQDFNKAIESAFQEFDAVMLGSHNDAAH